jgi:transcriptional regulator with XRE-family HTH domain
MSKPSKTLTHELSKPSCGKQIVALRIRLKINQAELGKRVGSSAMSISRWEAESHQPEAKYLIGFGLLATLSSTFSLHSSAETPGLLSV